MNTIQETPQDYTFMKATGLAIQLTSKLERLGDRHQPIRFFYDGRLMEASVRDVDDEPIHGQLHGTETVVEGWWDEETYDERKDVW